MNKLIVFAMFLLLTMIGQPRTVFCDLRTDLNDVITYPNPVRTAIGNDQVTFNNLTSNVTIKIFKINSSLVKEIEANDTNGIATWDLTNDSGEKVGSAIYLYLITNPAGQKFKGKLAVIR
ncbi:MAG: T9SS type A sorting domain-containing protein [bacterium]|nr:T9SS type A sorting domain-containing protein [bacterium]MDD5757320.1 T9SS type A sorting domain-containing protein [bacterium]